MADAKPAAAEVKPAPRKKVTIPQLVNKMKAGDPIVQLAVYDYETAIVADRVGVDILCVSDTGGMVLFGHESTVSVSFEEVMFMAQAVKRGSQYGLRMVDMLKMLASIVPRWRPSYTASAPSTVGTAPRAFMKSAAPPATVRREESDPWRFHERQCETSKRSQAEWTALRTPTWRTCRSPASRWKRCVKGGKRKAG